MTNAKVYNETGNLRVTPQENRRNQKKSRTNASGVIVDGKVLYLGLFDELSDAEQLTCPLERHDD